jgi:hypothetical protein
VRHFALARCARVAELKQALLRDRKAQLRSERRVGHAAWATCRAARRDGANDRIELDARVLLAVRKTPASRVSDAGPIPSVEAPPAPRTPPAASPGPRYRSQFTADQAYIDLLEEARELLQHSTPDRELVEVQRRALQALVKQLRARRQAATDRPRPSAPPASGDQPPRQATPASEPVLTACSLDQSARSSKITAPARRLHIPAAVRRAVWQRDAARCTYGAARGQRCRERAGLELHHLAPQARGGAATVDN